MPLFYSARVVGKYVFGGVWVSIFVGMFIYLFLKYLLIGIIVCLCVYGWKEVLSFISAASNAARVRSHFLDDMFFYMLLVLVGTCAFPGMSMIELTCGFVLGFKEGFVVCLLGTVSASVVSFSLGRYYMMDSINEYLNSDGKFRLYLQSIEQRNGLTLLVLFRLMFIPFFIKNYGPSVIKTTTVSHFLLAVLLTSPPYVALLTFIGSEAKSITDIVAGGGHAEFRWIDLIPVVVSIIAGALFAWLAYVEFQSLTKQEDQEDVEQLREPLVA